jgi:hypothetical protein
MVEELLRVICGNLKLLQIQAETELKTVEGDSNLADLQGFIDGVRDVYYEMGLSQYFPAEPIKVDIPDMSHETVVRYEYAAECFEELSDYQSVRDSQAKLIEAKKEYLFREAKKGRDLAYVTGWRHAVEYINEFCFQLKEAGQGLANENPLFYQEMRDNV